MLTNLQMTMELVFVLNLKLVKNCWMPAPSFVFMSVARSSVDRVSPENFSSRPNAWLF